MSLYDKIREVFEDELKALLLEHNVNHRFNHYLNQWDDSEYTDYIYHELEVVPGVWFDNGSGLFYNNDRTECLNKPLGIESYKFYQEKYKYLLSKLDEYKPFFIMFKDLGSERYTY